jgi:hypothetical protein
MVWTPRLYRGLGVLAVVASPIMVFWWLGDRLDSVCREGAPERCGMWRTPQRWNPDTVKLLGIVASVAFVVSIGLLVWAWYRHQLRSGTMEVIGLLIGAGAALGFSARVLSARIDDDGTLGYIVVLPVLAVAVGLVVAAGVEAFSLRKEAHHGIASPGVERW